MAIVTSQCWESCYKALTNDSNRDVMQKIYKIGNEVKKIKDIYSTDGVVFLLDSTIANQCRESSSSSSSSFDSWEDDLGGENATAIWTMQLQLMSILAAMIGSPRVYPVQFNENAAWACNSYSCLSTCQTIDLIKKNFLSPVQVNTTSCDAGLLEAACRIGYRTMTTATCTTGPINNMTIAILNSNAHSHVNKKGDYEEYSPCKNLFNFRYALGLHHADFGDLERFQSSHNYHNYISDNWKTRNMVQGLFSCIDTTCCGNTATPAVVAATTTSGCNIGFGDTGEWTFNLTAGGIPPFQP